MEHKRGEGEKKRNVQCASTALRLEKRQTRAQHAAMTSCRPKWHQRRGSQLRYVSIIKFRSLHCRRHSSVRRLIWRLYPRFFFFFLPRERSNTILRYTADISKYIAGWDRSGRVPLEGEKSRARCKSYLSLDTHTCWLCSLEISSCLITVVTGDNPISCSIARKVENYTYNS